MRIVIDLQGAQSESRFRGIGRYTLSLALAMARNAGEHEIWLALNTAFPESVSDIYHAFDGLIPRERIRLFQIPSSVAEINASNAWRARAAEKIREHFLVQLNPDWIFLTSLFEGYVDDAVTSISAYSQEVNVAVTIHDLIPLLDQNNYLPTAKHKSYYFRKLEQLKKANIFLAVSEASRKEAIRELGLQEDLVINTAEAIDDFFQPITLSENRIQELRKRYGIQRKMVLYAPGGFDVRKNFAGLMRAYALQSEEVRSGHQLVIASKLHEGDRISLLKLKQQAGLRADELVLTGYVSDDDLVALYNLATLFVFPSTHEGFGLPALEAMACGAPTIGSGTSSLPEVIGWEEALFDPADEHAMAEKIREALTNETFRTQLHEHGLKQAGEFSWEKTASSIITALEIQQASKSEPEKTNTNQHQGVTDLLTAIAAIDKTTCAPTESDLAAVAEAIAFNTGWDEPKQWLIDISEIVQRDAKSGIQRVVRSILIELLTTPPSGYEIRPIYFDGTQYRYATCFMATFLNEAATESTDDVAEFNQGDIYLALDLNAGLTPVVHSIHQMLRGKGVHLLFVVYDILLVQRPDWWPAGTAVVFQEWLKSIAQVATGLLCISESVATEVTCWVKHNAQRRPPELQINSFHLGADVENSSPTKGMPATAPAVLENLQLRQSFLMVGTLEPRKGHAQTLAAFEQLWSEGLDINLVIVGKNGWLVDALAKNLREHPEQGKRLYWLEGISDEYLEKIYAGSTCLIAASEGEGFGLPIIEAAQHKLPVIARNIPVFIEVAAGFATWFSGYSPEDMATVLRGWIKQKEQGTLPDIQQIPWLTWRESADQLKRAVNKSLQKKCTQ